MLCTSYVTFTTAKSESEEDLSASLITILIHYGKKKKKKSILQNVLPPACGNEKMTTLWEVLAYPVREALDALTGQNSISSLIIIYEVI